MSTYHIYNVRSIDYVVAHSIEHLTAIYADLLGPEEVDHCVDGAVEMSPSDTIRADLDLDDPLLVQLSAAVADVSRQDGDRVTVSATVQVWLSADPPEGVLLSTYH